MKKVVLLLAMVALTLGMNAQKYEITNIDGNSAKGFDLYVEVKDNTFIMTIQDKKDVFPVILLHNDALTSIYGVRGDNTNSRYTFTKGENPVMVLQMRNDSGKMTTTVFLLKLIK
tara:strand:+ start:193 stop:537 length:345 start_codon:yes stop_codon:yes gene_type:complete